MGRTGLSLSRSARRGPHAISVTLIRTAAIGAGRRIGTFYDARAFLFVERALSSYPLVKFLRYALPLGVVWTCACTVPSSPAAPSPVAVVESTIVSSQFEAGFYRAFLQNGYEAPDHLEPIRILKGPLRVYLRNQDEAGRSIDEITLNSTERILRDSAWIWSGETFGVAEVARGAGTREKVPGWITVKWRSSATDDRCGRSTVGAEGGYIEFNLSSSCSCGMASGGVYPRLIRHELGHAMGYYHTDSLADVMYGQAIPAETCDALPSDRERRHAKFAYGAPY